MKLIDADKLEYMQIGTNAYVRAEDILLAKTVDAVPVRYGHWIEDPDDWEYQCSECRHLSSCRTIYCSACGARMYGKGNGNEAD